MHAGARLIKINQIILMQATVPIRIGAALRETV